MAAMIWCPFPDEVSAAQVARQLLDEKLIACANILGSMRSLYEWNGERGDAREVPVLLKTDARLLERAVARVAELHPYDTPAVLGWRCDAAASRPQLGWDRSSARLRYYFTSPQSRRFA